MPSLGTRQRDVAIFASSAFASLFDGLYMTGERTVTPSISKLSRILRVAHWVRSVLASSLDGAIEHSGFGILFR